MNKKKIINDPLYGLIRIPFTLIFDLIEHPYFQRLRHIRQLGLTEYVYPGAVHNRFQHALGAMHLMQTALNNLRHKGIEVDDQEYEGAMIAVLLHDIGHGPFSHTLEETLLPNIQHEDLSVFLIEKLNDHFSGALSLALKIFKNEYERKFFHQLVSSQLDVDRLDYLNRDSFYTGVHEGTIGIDRILRMITVVDDQLVVEEKGIYSIENFLNARRLMYWQVYLHKATIGIDKVLVQIIKRALDLTKAGVDLPTLPALKIFLKKRPSLDALKKDPELLKAFAALDDHDIWGSIKLWLHTEDFTLSTLSNMLMERKLFRVYLNNQMIPREESERLINNISNTFNISAQEAGYFLMQGISSNAAYIAGNDKIYILTKTNEIIDIAQAAELPNIKAISKIVKKYFLCYPKILSL